MKKNLSGFQKFRVRYGKQNNGKLRIDNDDNLFACHIDDCNHYDWFINWHDNTIQRIHQNNCLII